MDTKQPEALRAEIMPLLNAFGKAQWKSGRGLEHPDVEELGEAVFAAVTCLHAENESLHFGYEAACSVIEGLQKRVQELGEMARENRSKKVIELEGRIAEMKEQMAAIGAGGVEPLRKRECLHQISEPTQPAAQAAPEDASARFKAQHEFLIWNREQTPPPIESATEYSVFNQAVDFYIAARAAQEGK